VEEAVGEPPVLVDGLLALELIREALFSVAEALLAGGSIFASARPLAPKNSGMSLEC
jgi:hypothetical protein